MNWSYIKEAFQYQLDRPADCVELHQIYSTGRMQLTVYYAYEDTAHRNLDKCKRLSKQQNLTLRKEPEVLPVKGSFSHSKQFMIVMEVS